MHLHQAFTSTPFLKATAIILGFLFWTIIGDSFPSYRWVTVPVAFYNTSKSVIEAPETVKVQLKGKRSQLRALDENQLAVHINAQELNDGPHQLEVTREMLLLPATISLGDIIPLNLAIKIKKEVS